MCTAVSGHHCPRLHEWFACFILCSKFRTHSSLCADDCLPCFLLRSCTASSSVIKKLRKVQLWHPFAISSSTRKRSFVLEYWSWRPQPYSSSRLWWRFSPSAPQQKRSWKRYCHCTLCVSYTRGLTVALSCAADGFESEGARRCAAVHSVHNWPRRACPESSGQHVTHT
jgi:hypothetical protein